MEALPGIIKTLDPHSFCSPAGQSPCLHHGTKGSVSFPLLADFEHTQSGLQKGNSSEFMKKR